jgi:capsular polysaccharide biosynthesis protein
VVTSYEVLSKTIETLGLKQSVSSLRGQVAIETVLQQNSFTIIASSDTPEHARELVKVLSSNLVYELSEQYKINAIDFYMRELTVEERRLQDAILKQEKLLVSQQEQLSKIEKAVT